MSAIGDIQSRISALIAQGNRYPDEIALHPDTLRDIVQELATAGMYDIPPGTATTLLGIRFHVDNNLDARFAFLYR